MLKEKLASQKYHTGKNVPQKLRGLKDYKINKGWESLSPSDLPYRTCYREFFKLKQTKDLNSNTIT